MSPWVVSLQGRAGWVSSSCSAGRCPCPWISDHTGARSSFCIRVEQALEFVLNCLCPQTPLCTDRTTWNGSGILQGKGTAQSLLRNSLSGWYNCWFLWWLGSQQAGFCSHSYSQWRVLYLPLCFKLQCLTDISLFPAVWNLVSSVAFLLPSASACLPEGNILAVFPSEDVFGNLDEPREWIVSFILIANTTTVIWLHSCFHLHIIIVEHQPALRSGSSCPGAGPPQPELLVCTWCFC